MKKICLIVFLSFLIGLVVWEEIIVNEALTKLSETAEDLQTRVYELGAVDNSEIKDAVIYLEEIWNKYEKSLCFIVNHKEE